MNRLVPLVAVALAGSVLAVLAGVSLTESAATTPGRNGRIVYRAGGLGGTSGCSRFGRTERAERGSVTSPATRSTRTGLRTAPRLCSSSITRQGDAGLLGGDHER